MKTKTALIAGSSGLVGHELLHLLLNGKDYKNVIALVRSPLGVKHDKLTEVVFDFDRLEEKQHHFTAVDDVFCALGTTIKKAKTKEAMYKVDVEYPLTIAKLAKNNGAKHFLIVSSINANPNALFWYPKIKGELEEQLKSISFQTLSIFRPALLLGDRNEFRFFENIAGKIFHGLSFFAKGSLGTGLAIEAKTVAKAMYKAAQTPNKGITIYSSKQMGKE